MLIIIDEKIKTKQKHHICPYHKKFPNIKHPGCTCSSNWNSYNETIEVSKRDKENES